MGINTNCKNLASPKLPSLKNASQAPRLLKSQAPGLRLRSNHHYTYIMEYYSAIKKNEILPFVATWMDLEGFMLREISWKEKDKSMTSLICGT